MFRAPRPPENIVLPPSGDPFTEPPPGANAKIVAIHQYWRRTGSDAAPILDRKSVV